MTVEAAPTTDDPRWQAAQRDFDAGHYFEAHEIWEDLWNDAAGEEKILYQSLAQIAAGYAKLEVGEVNGARKLFERGLARLGSTSLSAQLHPTFAPSVEEALRVLKALPWGATAGLTAVPRPRV